jgi:uncharacterized protein (TIGR03437 family)
MQQMQAPPALALLLLLPIAAAQDAACRLTPVSPAQPPLKVEESERALESQTFASAVSAVSPSNQFFFFDTASRLRRIESNGRLSTVAGSCGRAETLAPGPALATQLPNVTQILFSPDGVLHFVAVQRVFKLVDGRIEAAAGSGRFGFNGESGAALELNLGAIVHAAFLPNGELLLIDAYNRVRALSRDGASLRTVAGSTRFSVAAGRVGDGGPAIEAALSSPRQVIPFADNSYWIKDLSGRHLRLVTPDGKIDTVNTNFDAAVSIMLLSDGSPSAAAANRLFPLNADGFVITGRSPYPPFTGTPRVVGPDGALYFQGSNRPDANNPLVRITSAGQTVVAAAPVAPTVDGQAPPFGVYYARNASILYATTFNARSGIVEARPGQSPKMIIGGGAEIGDADGKPATSLTIFGVQAFTTDPAGRIIVGDVYRRRILVVTPDGNTTVLKGADGQQIVYTNLGTLSTLQRIAADAQGNIYWYTNGATPTGGVFTADLTIWTRATQSLSTFTVTGLNGLNSLGDGTVFTIAGNGANFRSARPIALRAAGAEHVGILGGLSLLPLQSATLLASRPYFTAASRLFRNAPGSIEWLNLPALPSGTTFTPDFVLASPEHLYVHLTDGGFYRFDNPDTCNWVPQPRVNAVVNTANYAHRNTVSPRTLFTAFGTGLGPVEGQSLILDGNLRAGGQPPPYPALVLGTFTGANPQATLSGTTLPVIFSNHEQVTVQAQNALPAGGEWLLYFSWQGLQLIHPTPIRGQATTPGLFAPILNQDNSLNSAQNPARAGSVVQLYATGLGNVTGTLTIGEFASTTTLFPTTAATTVLIGDRSAEVLFSGAAPGAIGGLYQVNVKIPDALPPGLHPVVITVGTASSESPLPVTLATN